MRLRDGVWFCALGIFASRGHSRWGREEYRITKRSIGAPTRTCGIYVCTAATFSTRSVSDLAERHDTREILAAHHAVEDTLQTAGAWRTVPEPESGPEPERADCKTDCKRSRDLWESLLAYTLVSVQ